MPPFSRSPLMALVLLLGALPLPPLTAEIPRSRIYSHPDLPTNEELRRLNLRLAWRGYIPVDGTRDAVNRVDLMGKDLFAMTRSGTIQRMDAETGKVHWKVRVGRPYRSRPFFAVNGRSVYLVADAKMYGLDRTTGRQKWVYDIPAGVSADPIADEEQIYLPTATTRLYAYYLPFVTGPEETDAGVPSERNQRSTLYGGSDDDHRRPAPRPLWSEVTDIRLLFPPIQTPETILVVGPSGRGFGFAKVPAEGTRTTEVYALRLEGGVRVAPGSYGDTVYIGSDDATLYAMDVNNGRLRWRYTAGTPITRSPVATAKDVYVTSDREGLARIDRATGEAVWRIPSGRSSTRSNLLADRFFAANDRFVYASDNAGRLLVLDRKRGVRLSTLDTRAYRVPVINEITDRLYLAANDGLIVCLHDRDVVQPLRHRKAIEDASSPIVKILDQKVDEPGGRDTTLREALAELGKKYKIRPVIAERAFRAAGRSDIEDAKVRTPRSEAKPLKDHLQRLLKEAGASYEVVDQAILVIPAR